MSAPSIDSYGWRAVLVASAVSLALSVLLLLALRVSTDPLPGSLGHDLMVWLKEVATITGSALLALALVLRAVTAKVSAAR